MIKYMPSVAVWGLVLLSLLLFKLNALPLAILILFSALLTYVLFVKKISKEKSLIFYILYLIFFYGLLKHFSLSADKSVWYYTALSRTASIIDSEFILILVTSLYVIFTYKMFTEMEKSRIISQRPNVIARPEQEGAWQLSQLTLKNIGATPAFDVNIDFTITKNTGDTEKHHWNTSVLQSMEEVKLLLAEYGIINFYEKNSKMEIDLSYEDKEKTKFNEQMVFDLKKSLKGIKNSIQILPNDREYERTKSLGVIAGESRRISKSLEYLSAESKNKVDAKHIALFKKRQK